MMPEGKGIQSNQTFNEQVEGNTDFLTTLKAQLPEFFNGNAFDKSKFDAALKATNVDELSDGYRLDFIGKNYAKRQVGQRPTSLIIPDQKHNQKEQNASSKNLFFTGDNLEVLRHLRQNYANSVDFIYIDPPYNTGSDGFVYPDSFNITDEMLTEFGVDPSDNIEVKAFKERYNQQGKKSHSAWLTFMYPRLVLARKLLKDDGVIFVSIDDNEQANLKLMLDDIFGESNFVGTIIHQNAKGGGNAKYIVKGHDTINVFAKNINDFSPLVKPKVVQGQTITINGVEYIKNDDIYRKQFGKYEKGTERRLYYEDAEKIKGPKVKKEIDRRLACKEIFLEERENGKHILYDLKPISEARSKFYSVVKELNEQGKNRLDDLGLNDTFSYPKPVEIVKSLIQSRSEKNIIVLDFFAGSATTADAVMQLNKEDGGNRQYIMVQLPEKLAANSVAAKAGFTTIDEISRTRIERAAEKIGDTSGYQHYTVEQVEAETLDQLEKFDPNAILLDDIVTEIPGGVDTLLTTWMTADGYPFGEPVEKKEFGNGVGYYVAGSVLYILENTWDSEATKQLLNEIGEHCFNLNTIIVSEYALTFEAMTELKTNIKLLRDKDFDIQVEVRN